VETEKEVKKVKNVFLETRLGGSKEKRLRGKWPSGKKRRDSNDVEICNGTGGKSSDS